MASNPQYDYLVVGSGLFGATFAHQARKAGHRVLVIDRRSHRGGNVWCQEVEGIQVHKYGAHIFHTSNLRVWQFVNTLVPFNRFTNSPMARYQDRLYNLPFNMHTFMQLWGVQTPAQARAKVEEERAPYANVEPQNLEEQALKLVGPSIYERLIKGYTEKQWGRSCTQLPAFIIRRLPLRFTFDNNYFNDAYQGIPQQGYNALVGALLQDIEVRLDSNYFENRPYWDSLAKRVLYTGPIDQFFDFQLGRLEYRSLRFEEELLKDKDDFQGVAVVNYTERQVPFTRIIEHKHFLGTQSPSTIITREYPDAYAPGKEPYYPVNDTANQTLYNRYKEMADAQSRVLFGGRLAQYTYADMDDTIALALELADKELGNAAANTL